MKKIEINLHATAPQPHDYRQYPIHLGVPFPKGWIKDMSELSLEDLNGDQIPLDYSPTLCWCDGSVKWGYIIFMANYTSPKKECYQRLLWYFPVQSKKPFKIPIPITRLSQIEKNNRQLTKTDKSLNEPLSLKTH